MAETDPLLDMSMLQDALKDSSNPQVNIPKVPFVKPNLPLPTVDGKPTPSALSALRNSVVALPNNGVLTGGSIPRSMAESSSPRYNNVVPGDYDNEDAYAQGQGWPAKMVNGVGKGLTLTGTTFLQSTLGMVNGVARWIDTGRFASVYDNDFNRALDEINKQLEDTLPNYYTNVEKNAKWYSPSYFFTGNFLWDGVVKNLGFAAGAALSGGVYATALKAIPLTSRLFSIGKAAEVIAATEEGLLAANKAASTYGKIKSLSDNFLSSYSLLNPAGRGVVAALATTGEAGFEAYHNLNDFRDKKIKEWEDSHNGISPKGADLEAINREADEVGNLSFKLNTALLSATNYIQFPAILGSTYKGEKGMINSLTREISEISQDATGKFIQKAPTTLRGKFLSAVNGIRPYLFSASEGFEEGAQFAITVGTEDYYNKLSNKNEASFLDSVIEGVSNNSDEFAKNVLIGGLSGALMLGRGKFRENAQIRRNTGQAVSDFNRTNLSDFTKEMAESVNRGVAIQQERETLLRQGDILESKDKERDYLINYLTPRIKYGRYDLVVSDLNEYKQLASTAEGFAQLQAEGKALPEDTREAYLQRLQNVEATANNMKSLYQSLQLRYGNLVGEDGNPVFSAEVMNKMIYAATKVADYDNRIPKLSTDLITSGVVVNDVIDDVLAGNSEAFNNAVGQIAKLDVLDDVKESHIQALTDVAELSLRRRKFLEEYNEIKSTPNKFKKVEVAEVPDETNTITIKTADGEEDLIIGEEYFLGNVVEYDKSGKEIYRFPKLTILGENVDGTIEIQDSSGNRRNVEKSVLADYKLGKVRDVENNKKAKFFLTNINNIFEFNFGKGNKVRGRLEYSSTQDALTFVYKDKKGKVKRIEVYNHQFKPKDGFSNAQIKKVGELTPAERQAQEELVNSKETRTVKRNEIIADMYESSKTRLDTIQKELDKSKEDLASIQKQIEEAPFTKAGNPRKNINYTRRAINRLSEEREKTINRISELQDEETELNLVLPYLQDLVDNMGSIPELGQEFINQTKEDINHLETLIEETRDNIASNQSFLEKVEASLQEATSLLNDYIKRLKEENPNIPLSVDSLIEQLERFLGEEGTKQYLEQKLGFTEATLQLEDDISSFREELKIPDLSNKKESLQKAIKDLENELDGLIAEQIAKVKVLETFETRAEAHRTQKEQERKLAKDKKLRKELLGTADSGVQTTISDKKYEPQAKKSNVEVVTSTKPATKSTLTHHVRANTFGSNLNNFPNKDKIKGVLVTSKNEDSILPGLTAYLKGDSDVDASKIIALVMVEDGIPVGVDGKPLENPSVENAIFQVMPDPELTWSKEFGGESMFRKETTPEQIAHYKKLYKSWVEEILANPSSKEHTIEVSFGIPEYVTITNEEGKKERNWDAIVSVEDAGLIKSSDLVEKGPLIYIPTVETTIQKGSTAFNTPSGRPFLNLPNAYVKLNNRKLTPKEATTVYQAIYELSKEVNRDGNAKSDKSKRLIQWLRSVVYWGTPNNKQTKERKPAGYNSIFFDNSVKDEFLLYISGLGNSYPFSPGALEANKEEIITLLEGMYNNVNSGLTDKADLWNEPYEEIINITPSGEIETREWPNYQSYLLSSDGRTSEEIPLYVQFKPIKEGETNRTGIYFTIKDELDRFPELSKPNVKPAKAASPSAPTTYVLDGKTRNLYISPTGKKIYFSASGLNDIKISKEGDLDEVLKALSATLGEEKAKQNIKDTIKVAIKPYIAASSKGITGDEKISVDDFDEGSENITPTSTPKITKEDELLMSVQIDDIEDDDIVLRVRLEEETNKYKEENWNSVEKWLSTNFPNLPVYRVKNIIQATNGRQAWGMLKDGAIYVYENAEVGTVYHEVFEGVWKAFTSVEEQGKIKAEFRNRSGSFIDRPTGKRIKYKDATDLELKEQLAEEFRDYVLSQKPKKGLISQLFEDIVKFIRSFFTGNSASSNTDKLFEKIGSGYYKKYLPISSNLAFAKEGIIDVEEAFADDRSEFSVANLSADVVHDIMQHMTYLTLYDLVDNNRSLFTFTGKGVNKKELYEKLKVGVQKSVLKTIKEEESLIKTGNKTLKEAEPNINKAKSLWKIIGSEWESLKKKHQEYLRSYNIEFDENDELNLKDEDNTGKGEYDHANKIDHFRKLNSAVKLLFSTLPRLNSNGKFVRSSINGAILLPVSEVYMAVMNRVHDASSIDEMVARVKEMAEENPDYRALYNRLTKNTSDLSQISEVHDAQLLAAFWRSFKKQNPDVKNVYIFENGEVEVGDSSLSSAARQISNEYGNQIIATAKSKNPYFEYVDKERAFRGKPSGIKNVKLTNDEQRVKFLASLGINFKVNELPRLGDKLTDFRKAVAGIRKSIEDADKIATINRKVLDIKGRLLKLAEARAILDHPEFDSTFFNVNGERTQSFIGTNPISDFKEAISKISNLSELRNTRFDYLLTDSFSQGSVVLNKLFNPNTGNRISGNDNLLKPGYADGTVNNNNGKKKQSSKMTFKERRIQELNLNLNGYYYNLVPGDASMEWMVNMGNHITPANLLSGWKRVHSIFKEYFISEMQLSREERPIVGAADRDTKDLRFLKDILGKELHSKIIQEIGEIEEVYNKYEKRINSAVEKFIESEASSLEKSLRQYNIITYDAEGLKIENLQFPNSENITEEELKRNLLSLSANYIINNIELHKLIYSDPYQYKDELKRIKSANSPRQPIINNSHTFNIALNNLYNKGYKKGEIGHTDFKKDYFKTATLSDVISTSELKDYGTFEETDGGGIITFPAYRLFRIKAGDWNENEEAQYRYDIAYEKKAKGVELSEEESSILKKGNPSIKSAYTPLKPIVFGRKLNDKKYNDVVLDKFALYPLSFRIAHEINPTSNAIKQYNKMQREGVDYSVFFSGRKVGSEGSNRVYNPDGSFNTLPYQHTVNIPHSIIAIQSEVPSKEENSVTRGSQITKLATLDYMEAGVPIDFQKDKDLQNRFEEWNKLSEKEKEEISPLFKEIKYNQTLLENLTENGYKTLLDKLGIIETEEGFKIEDENIEKIASVLEEEMLKREVNDNILDAFEGFRAGDVILEATPVYQQVRNILYSIADKNVIHTKISGGQKVQIPVTLLETVKAKEEQGAYTSDFLRFYENEDGKRTCEIMVGRWFDSGMSDKALLNYLNNTEEGQKLLSGVAFRVPTQKQNSIESFVVKQFLPREFGDSVVIPSELVKKVGSDFDIDKLFIYLKNVLSDKKGRPYLAEYKGSEEATRKFYEDLYVKEIGEDISKIERYDEFRDRVVEVFQVIESVEDRSNLSDEGISFLLGEEMTNFYFFHKSKLREIAEQAYEEEMLPSQYIQKQIEDLGQRKQELALKVLNEELKKKYVDRHYKQALENEYIQSLQNLISHPLNFDNLIKPNSAEQLKVLAKEVTNKLGIEQFNYSAPVNMLKMGFMTRLRQAFVSGKYTIGIAAVNQTNHSLNQRQPIYIDVDKWDVQDPTDQYWLSGGTMKAEDVNIKFKNYNKLRVGDRIVPSLSGIKNSSGEYISDIIGQFIDGYVDIAKGPWIMELGATTNVAPVWLLLTKIGVPIRDIAFFMNQPIIHDYLRQIENAGYSWPFIDSFAKEVAASYSEKPSSLKTIPSATKLKDMMGKKSSDLSSEERDIQVGILTEFLKYAKMANHMFLVTQGSNFDTANFNDPYLVFKKHEQLKKAQNSIISSVDKLIQNSFIEKLQSSIYSIREAFSSVLMSDRDNVRDVIEEVLRPYVDLNDREFVKLARTAVNTLFDWAVQTDRNINKQVQNILLSDNNAAKQIDEFKKQVRKNPKHPLYNNQVIKLITPHYSDRVGGVNNLKIKNQSNKVYDQNQMIYAFKEIKQFLGDSPLYGKLVRLAVLQSGLSNSPISFTSLLPYKDFKEIYNKTLSRLNELPNLQDFVEYDVFHRTNWNNYDIVPLRKAQWKKNKNGDWRYNNNMKFYGNWHITKAIESGKIPKLVKINSRAREANNDIITYTWEEGSKAEKAEMRKKHDFSYIKRGLFKKIYRGDTPLELSFTASNGDVITDYVYKAINAWGDSQSSDGVYYSANEFYSTPQSSVIENRYIKPKEMSDESIIVIIDKESPVEEGSDQVPDCA